MIIFWIQIKINATAKTANKVSNMGYRVKDVKYKKGDSKIKVKAKRGSEDYKIELGYPSYNVIKIKED